VPCLIGRRGFVMYRVERNDRLVEIVKRSDLEFWEKHVLPRVPPENVRPTLEILKHIRREPAKRVRIPEEVLQSYLDAQKAEREARRLKEHAQARLLAALGDAEAGECTLGTVEYVEVHRRGYVVEPTTYRKLTIRLNKEAKNGGNGNSETAAA